MKRERDSVSSGLQKESRSALYFSGRCGSAWTRWLKQLYIRRKFPEILLVDALAEEKKPIIAAQPDINNSVKRPVIKNVFNLLVAGVLLVRFKKHKIQLFSV